MLEWKEILKTIVNHPKLHGKFLNTLSMIEYIGARKILKSQNKENLNIIMLKHCSEELKHSIFLKSIALQVYDKLEDCYSEKTTLAYHEANNYIQGIDNICAKFLNKKENFLNYLLSTYTIEVRALEFYNYYNKILEDFNLDFLIKEEHAHLDEMNNQLNLLLKDKEKIIDNAQIIEQDLFEKFFHKIGLQLQEETLFL